jgi:hypothetical protein
VRLGRVGDNEDVASRTVGVPSVDGRQLGEHAVRVDQRCDGPNGQRPDEQPVAQLGGSADGTQCRVQDRDAIAQALGLRQMMCGQEDRRATATE